MDYKQTSSLKSYKWLIVLLNSVTLFASTYSTQDLSTQQINYKYQFRHIQDFEMYFNIIYMFSFVLLMVSNLFIGKLCDKYRPGFFVMGAAFFTFIGQFSILASVRLQTIGFLFLGRILLNLASTPLLMANGKLMAQLFDKKMLATANSICLTVNLLGTFINLRFSGLISENYGFMMSMIFAQSLACLGALFSLIVCALDITFAKKEQQAKIDVEMQQNNQYNGSSQTLCSQQEIDQIEEKKNQKNTWKNFLTSTTLPFILFAFSQGILNLSANIVEIIGPRFLYDEYFMSPTKAGSYMSIIPLTVVLMPLFSRAIDMFGKPLIWILPAAGLGTIAVLGLTLKGSALFFMFLFGIAFSLKWVSVFPGIEELCDRDHSGKAFAFIRLSRDIMGIGITLLNGFLYQKYQSYMPSMQLLIGFQMLALVAGVVAIFKKYNIQPRKISESFSIMNASIKTTDSLP